MTYGITQSEEVVKSWLIEEKDYSEDELEHKPNVTPDFFAPDKKFEAKKIYGKRLIFYESQLEDIEDETIIVATDLDEVKEVFKWSERGNSNYEIKIVDSEGKARNNGRLSVPKAFANDLRKNYEGDNDMERLRNWAEQFETEDEDRTEALDIYEHREEIEEIVDDRVEELRRRM